MRRSLPLLILLPLLALAATTAAQEPPPTFGRDIEVVTVDVVVADKKGNPVAGLTREDFTVLDEGVPQQLINFEVVEAPEPGGPARADAAAPARRRIVTNSAKRLPGRTFVVVFDNINMSPANALRAKSVVLAFLDKGLRDGDRVMLAATAGGAWWTATMPEGREDIVALLKGLDGRRTYTSAWDRMTDFEAMRVYQYNDARVGNRVSERFERYGQASRKTDERERQMNEIGQPGVIRLQVESKAAETYLQARTRNRTTFAALERLMKPLADSRDRKSVVLLSEGFVYDPQEDGFRMVIESARRANAALYFVDTRGLADMPGYYSAEFGRMIEDNNMLAALADMSQEAEGAVSLARDTGGFTVASTNDLETGIVRIAAESRRYYLMGYTPSNVPRDGRFRKIQVKVRRPGVVVRARRGYYAPRDAAAVAATPPKDTTDPQIQFGLDAPTAIDDIQLRLTTYVLEDAGLGRARVLLAADVDISKVDFREKDGKLLGVLDTLSVAARRETSEVFRNDQKVDLERKPGPVSSPSWYTIVREFELPPGTYQSKLVVRDANSRRLGTVSIEYEVPPADQLRLSTPILTDRLQVTPGGTPNAILLARRTFDRSRPLFCRFDVFGAATDPATRMPKVRAGHVLRRVDGTVLSRSEPTEIAPTSIGGVSRLMQIPLADAVPGEYELELVVHDDRSGRSLTSVEPFTVTGS